MNIPDPRIFEEVTTQRMALSDDWDQVWWCLCRMLVLLDGWIIDGIEGEMDGWTDG